MVGVVWVTCGLLQFFNQLFELILMAPIHRIRCNAEVLQICYNEEEALDFA